MTRWLFRYFSIFYVSTYLLVFPLSNAQDMPSQADLDALALTITDIQAQIENTRQQRGSIEIELEANEKAINEINQSITSIEDRINVEHYDLLNLKDKVQRWKSKEAPKKPLSANILLLPIKTAEKNI